MSFPTFSYRLVHDFSELAEYGRLSYNVQIRARRDRHLARIAEVSGIAAFTVGAMFILAYTLGSCIDVPEWKAKGYGFTFHCESGESQRFNCSLRLSQIPGK